MRLEADYVHDHIHSCTKEDEEEAIFLDSEYLIWRLIVRSRMLRTKYQYSIEKP